MSFSKKTAKLLRDPIGFFRDSRHFHMVFGLNSSSNKRKNSTSVYPSPTPSPLMEKNNVLAVKRNELMDVGLLLSPRESPLEKEYLYSKLKKNVPFFLIENNDGERDSVCVLAKNYIQALIEVTRFSYQEGIELAYDFDQKIKKPTSVREILKDLSAKSIVNFRLMDYRSDSVIYFQIQKWNEGEDFISSPSANIYSRKVWKDVVDKVGLFDGIRKTSLSDILTFKHEDDIEFDVDYVFSWVNSEDPDWKEMYKKHKPGFEEDGNSLSRFMNRDELKFSLRSINEFAPWVRKIHIVTNCKPPEWINLSNSKINWVYHEDIFDEKNLPTFSSHAIEANLHKIPGLSNYFIYSNDDFMLSRPTTKKDFFESNGLCKIKFEQWGNVNGDVKAGDPDYLNAARNCNSLLESDFQVTTTQLHCHAPQAMRKDVLIEMENKYRIHFERTSSNKFRDKTDIAVSGYFFHHYSYITGRGIKDKTKTLLIQQNHNFTKLYAHLINEKSVKAIDKRYLSFCVNDGGGSHLNERWNVETINFLNSYFPNKSVFEK